MSTITPHRSRVLALALGLLLPSLAGCGAGGAGGAAAGGSGSIANAAIPSDGHVHAGGVHVLAEGKDECPVCDLYERRRDSVVRIRTESGLGTGVVIDSAGSILTNAHVVGDSAEVLVETYHGTVVRGKVERRGTGGTKGDAGVDLALVRVSAPDVKWIGQGPSLADPPPVGSPVYVIGHPAGLGWTITTGILSANRPASASGAAGGGGVGGARVLQITAAVSPGNSGGPAFDAKGNWIGTVTSKLVGTGLENISFVIPAAELRRFLSDDQSSGRR